ncbi:hypothetical protein IAT40_004595 [Kwoniella sp. CBS 6097]
MPYLPDEVVVSILSYLEGYQEDLSSFSLASKRFDKLATPVLWKRLFLTPSKSPHLSSYLPQDIGEGSLTQEAPNHRAIEPEHRRMEELALYVERLTFHHYKGKWCISPQFFTVSFPNLKVLHLFLESETQYGHILEAPTAAKTEDSEDEAETDDEDEDEEKERQPVIAPKNEPEVYTFLNKLRPQYLVLNISRPFSDQHDPFHTLSHLHDDLKELYVVCPGERGASADPDGYLGPPIPSSPLKTVWWLFEPSPLPATAPHPWGFFRPVAPLSP